MGMCVVSWRLSPPSDSDFMLLPDDSLFCHPGGFLDDGWESSWMARTRRWIVPQCSVRARLCRLPKTASDRDGRMEVERSVPAESQKARDLTMGFRETKG